MNTEAALGHKEIQEDAIKNARAGESVWTRRVEDYLRHVKDLQNKYYEGAVSRADREALFMKAFDFATPVARRVLDDMNANFLKGTADFIVQRPTSDGEGGLVGSWSLTWPLLRRAVCRFDGKPLDPLAVTAIFPLKSTGAMQWTHPHLALRRPGLIDGLAAAFPFQVTSPEDAERQEPILRVLAEAEFHERFYQSDLNWRLLPFVAE
ncbi:MAG TPA: hypothetical protein VEN79_18830 [Terriglobia bacterium]|nr:hypothetical protein [Terriglobia bacterium]